MEQRRLQEKTELKNYNFNIFCSSDFSCRRLLSWAPRSTYSSTLLPESYAAHGVLETSSPISFESDDGLSVGIIAGAWPGWAIPFSHKRFELKWIVTLDKNLLSSIKRCFPSVKVILGSPDNMNINHPVDIICFNGPLERLRQPPPFSTLLFFDWNCRFKTNWKDWAIATFKLAHNKCGGVSDHEGVIKLCYHRASASSFNIAPDSLDVLPAASLGSILKHTENGEALDTAPRLARLASPAVTLVTHKSFHPNGLFPCQVVKPTFLVPSVFVPSRWVKRSLTRRELLAVYDIPASVISVLGPREQAAILSSICMPVKSLVAIMSTVFVKGIVSVIGGG